MTDFFNDYQGFQQEMESIELKSVAKIKTKQGKDFSYKYAGLPDIMREIKPLLKKYNFIVYWTIGSSNIADPSNAVNCHLCHSSKESIQANLTIPVGDNPDPKTVGAAITYARRYTLSCVLGLVTEEDTDAPERPSKSKSKPVLSNKSFDQAVKRIENGEKDVLKNVLLHFDLDDAQMDFLADLEMKTQ